MGKRIISKQIGQLQILKSALSVYKRALVDELFRESGLDSSPQGRPLYKGVTVEQKLG